MTNSRPPSRARRLTKGQRGVTLIEILITLLVLSVGLLGLAAIQGFSLQAGQVSHLRSQATNIAYEAIENARAHRAQVAQCTTAGGTTGDQYLDALEKLENKASRILPDADIETNFNREGPCDGFRVEFEVIITWRDARGEGEEEQGQFILRSFI